MADTFILDIEWDRPSPDAAPLPHFVGPFGSRKEAHEWAALNVPNESWTACPLAYPYHRKEKVDG